MTRPLNLAVLQCKNCTATLQSIRRIEGRTTIMKLGILRCPSCGLTHDYVLQDWRFLNGSSEVALSIDEVTPSAHPNVGQSF